MITRLSLKFLGAAPTNLDNTSSVIVITKNGMAIGSFLLFNRGRIILTVYVTVIHSMSFTKVIFTKKLMNYSLKIAPLYTSICYVDRNKKKIDNISFSFRAHAIFLSFYCKFMKSIGQFEFALYFLFKFNNMYSLYYRLEYRCSAQIMPQTEIEYILF